MPSANLGNEEAGKATANGKKNKQRQAKKQKGADKSAGRDGEPNKSLVNELKLFQNSNLLNQEDPLEQLQQQINQLIEDDDMNRRRLKLSGGLQQQQQQERRRPDIRVQGIDNPSNSHLPSLSAPSMPAMHMQPRMQPPLHGNMPAKNFQPNQGGPYYASHQEVFTVKKGVLWEQQNHERFHQRLFSRWKKRYFILTTDYLVCFKRSSSKVGRSEMGKFLYKIALSDVQKTDWLRPKRSDKGPIIVHVRNRFDLMLYAKKESDEWKLLINESVERLRIRKTIISNGHQASHAGSMAEATRAQDLQQGFYENSFGPKESSGEMIGWLDDGSAKHQSVHADAANPKESSGPSQLKGELTIDSTHTRGSSRTSSGSRRRTNEVAPSAVPQTANGDALALASSKLKPIDHGGKNDRHATTSDAELKSPLQAFRSNQEQRREVGATELGTGASDEIAISEGQSDGVGERRHQRVAAAREPDELERVAGRRSGRLASRPVANLIRRDDSWHSLVSLTHVGEANIPARRELRAPHIVGQAVNDGSKGVAGQEGALNGESTGTPLRAAGRLAPTRQHSIQWHSRRLQPIGAQQHAHSFDVCGPIPSSPSLHAAGNQQQTSALHHQRLMQLQLLHNSNNVDYIRTNKANIGGPSNEYQIYGPESVATTNHYGYYSMRSNLKSAASEFSFIRPNSSSFQQAQLATPMHAPPLVGSRGSGPLSLGLEQSSAASRKPLAMQSSSGQNPLKFDHNNNYSIAALNLVKQQQPVPHAVQLSQAYSGAGQITDQALSSCVPMAPNRELPLKPNKRRQVSQEQSGASSRGSAIVSFFRRAFSRRSKRRSKLVESCSSSLAAFDSNLDQIQVAQSAFSTGSKSARAERAPSASQQGGQQQQRMIDLIEAFANKTALEQTRLPQTGRPLAQQQSMDGDANQFGSIRPKFIRDQQLGSPLHKSNSISATSGLAGLNELAVYRNQRAGGAESGSGALQSQAGFTASPMITRSTKVMSANLTPLFASKNALEIASAEEACNMRHLARPSSIYGQPSMIGSPVSAQSGRNGPGAEMGLKRNSMHAGAGHRDRFANMDFRRQRAINALDTTREVAEELASPTGELERESLPCEQLYDHEINARLCYNVQEASSLVRASRMDAYHRYQQRQAVVNPILQSPTIGTIYDNHPAGAYQRFGQVQHQHQSLYDNQRRVDSFHDPDRDASGYSRPQILMPSRLTEERLNGVLASPMLSRDRSQQSHLNHQNAFCTPTREGPRQLVRSATTEVNRVFVRSKPAAIVAPTTPHRESTKLTHQLEHLSDPLGDTLGPELAPAARFIGHQASPRRTQQQQQQQQQPKAAVVSPMAARRSINQPQLQYQQSPLVDEQTRILKRGGRVQTTIIGSDHNADSASSRAPRRNNSESAAEGGVQLDADEGATRSSGNPSDGRSQAEMKSSSHSARPSEDSRENGNSNGKKRTTDKQTSHSSRSSEPETQSPSSGSRRTNSSASRRSGSSVASSLSEVTETNKSEPKVGRGQSKAKHARLNGNSHSQTSHSSSSKRRGSSTDQSDEQSSQTGSFDDRDEKNWINSKLVQ